MRIIEVTTVDTSSLYGESHTTFARVVGVADTLSEAKAEIKHRRNQERNAKSAYYVSETDDNQIKRL